MGLDNVKYLLIGIIVCIAVVTGGILTLNSFYNAQPSLDSVGDINQFNATMNKANEINQTVGSISSSINDVGDTGLLGWLNALVGSTFKGLKATGQSVSFLNVMVTDTSRSFGIPSAIVTILLLIIPIILIFAIWSAITKT